MKVETAQDRLANFIELLRRMRPSIVDGRERRFRPIMIAWVIKAIGDGRLTENRIDFDWLAPEFARVAPALGEPGVGEEQAALAFVHLTSTLFWMLCYRDPRRPLGREERRPAAIRERVRHARLAEPYWAVLQDADARRECLKALAERWFGGIMPPEFGISPPESERPLRRLAGELLLDPLDCLEEIETLARDRGQLIARWLP